MVFEAQCAAVEKLVHIESEKLRLHDGREMGTGKYLSLFQEYLTVQLKEMGKEQVRQVLWAAIGMTL